MSRDGLRAPHAHPATAAARPFLDRSGRSGQRLELDRGQEFRAHRDERRFQREQFRPQGQAREQVVFQGGVGEGVGSDGKALYPPSSRADRSSGDAERIQRAREEAIRATLENINGWGT